MTSTTSDPFPLATENPYTGGQDASAGSANAGGGVDDSAGAAGSSSAFQLSHGALVAIIVVVVVVAVGGIASAVLFYLTKKKEWRIRENLRRSAKKVVTALTPRRSEFPRSVKESSGRTSRGRQRLDDVPPTPKLRPEDLEKGMAVKIGAREGRGKRGGLSKWTRG